MDNKKKEWKEKKKKLTFRGYWIRIIKWTKSNTWEKILWKKVAFEINSYSFIIFVQMNKQRVGSALLEPFRLTIRTNAIQNLLCLSYLWMLRWWLSLSPPPPLNEFHSKFLFKFKRHCIQSLKIVEIRSLFPFFSPYIKYERRYQLCVGYFNATKLNEIGTSCSLWVYHAYTFLWNYCHS